MTCTRTCTQANQQTNQNGCCALQSNLSVAEAPLEQHFCRHPDDFFGRSLDTRLPDTANEVLLKGHVLCAAAELLPFSEAEVKSCFGDAAVSVLDELLREGRLIVQPPARGKLASDEVKLFRLIQGKGKKSPKEEVNLRDIDPVQFQIIVRGTFNPLETLDQRLAYMKLHPGAVYLNQTTSYFVEELDLQKRIAWVIPKDGRKIEYYTESSEHSTLVLAGGGQARPASLPDTAVCNGSTAVVRSGSATVHWRMYGFKKKSKKDHSILDTIELSFPPVEYQTRAAWMDLPGSVLQPVAQAGHVVDRGGLHALEHAMLALAPLCCDLEASELSCQHTRRDSDPNRYLLLLFESQKGGAGAGAAKLFAHWEELLSNAVRLIEECKCEKGCPNCIVISGCGEYNHGLDKAAALKIGRALGFGTPPTGALAGGTPLGSQTELARSEQPLEQQQPPPQQQQQQQQQQRQQQQQQQQQQRQQQREQQQEHQQQQEQQQQQQDVVQKKTHELQEQAETGTIPVAAAELGQQQQEQPQPQQTVRRTFGRRLNNGSGLPTAALQSGGAAGHVLHCLSCT
ncbi:unnamed protein product [Polarella glacialis]|uniref:MrfA-like Zn-binding domain-containing protein n=1 Tax=Polarella glacialis TaxID=89957 RepID=A0A813G714_POLGL|nr:unnamed protein product [Polarella glacialis]